MRGQLSFWLLCLLAAGCGPEDAVDLQTYFDATPYADPACEQVDERLRGEHELRLFVAGDLDVSFHTQALQRYYRRHGLELFTRAPPLTIESSYVLDTDAEALSLALAGAFPGADLRDSDALSEDPELYARVLAFSTNFTLRPMLEFARQYGSDGARQVTNFVVLPHLARSDRAGPDRERLAGLAVSPALLAALLGEDTAEGQFWRGVELPGEFTPMLFLDAEVLARAAAVDPALPDLVIAHELGHAGGLVHRELPGNLMRQGVSSTVSRCTDALEPDQLQTLRDTLLAEPGQTAP